MGSREMEREYVTAHEFARFEELFEADPEHDALFKARLKRFSEQWQSRLGCEERVYIPPITLDDHGEAQQTRGRLLYPLNEFEAGRGHYKSLHGTDVFIVRDDTDQINEMAQSYSYEDHDHRYSLPFHPQDQALMFAISQRPEKLLSRGEEVKEEPRWLSTFYYLAPYWISLDLGYWLRGWWHEERIDTPSCHANDSINSLHMDLEERCPLGYSCFHSSTNAPFMKHTPPRTLGPMRVPDPTASCCWE